MVAKLWQQLSVRLTMGWLVVVLLPALVMYFNEISHWQLINTQVNSIIVASVGVVFALVVLDKIADFPGQRSLVYVLPTLLITVVSLALFLLIFRFAYSVYYLTSAFFLGVVFLFISEILEKNTHRVHMAYIPLGRCQSFGSISGVKWQALDSPYDILDKRVQAIVADLSSPNLDKAWQRFLAQQTLQGVPVYNNLQVHESLTGRSPIQHLYENNLGSLLPSQGYVWVKQFIETLVVLMSLPIILPVALLTAIAICLESRGKVIFRQQRVGQGGKLFNMYKFRSMRVDAEKQGAKLAQKDDARVTRVGRFIRKVRIDELPQFVNVLKGEMSLIGPRPEQQSFVESFEKKIPFYGYRHIVKPGISGWAQVMQGYAGNTDETQTKIQYDFYYIKHFSFTLDMLIVIKTIHTIVTGFGAR